MREVVNLATNHLVIPCDRQPDFVLIGNVSFGREVPDVLQLEVDVTDPFDLDEIEFVLVDGRTYERIDTSESMLEKRIGRLEEANEGLESANLALASELVRVRDDLARQGNRNEELLAANSRLHLKITRDRSDEVSVPRALLRDLDHSLGVWNTTLGQGLSNTKFASLQTQLRDTL